MKKLLSLALLLLSISMLAQQRLNSSFAFQSDPAKKYSIYLPSGYTPGTPHRMMLGLHPLNPNRWDAESWCDTLTAFAEMNNLLLVCPDGGSDGRIDDPIDTAFTTALLDSMETWYSIDNQKVYVMGFSWGGKTTYTYGLRNSFRFGGFIPIGAAVNGVGDVTGFISNAANKAFYLVHGSFDAPSIRFTPILNALNTNNAIVESQLLSGVGHTIDFNNRNTILSRAYFWVDSVNCKQIASASSKEEEAFKSIDLFPNPLKSGEKVTLNLPEGASGNYEVSIHNLTGKLVKRFNQNGGGNTPIHIDSSLLKAGNYLILLKNGELKFKTNLSIVR